MEGGVGHGTRTVGYGAIDPSIRNEKITWSVIMSHIVAASCGLIFGYDLGISGLVSSLLASRVTKVFGRKFAILFGGCTFLVGSIVNCTAANVVMLILGRIFLDTPSSLVERGKLPEAREALLKVRGANSDIETELNELVEACETAREVDKISFKTIFERQYRPHLVIAGGIPFFQQLTGINTIAFYAPVLFNSVRFGNDAALKGAILLGLVNVGSIVASMFMVDKFGRRALFIEGGIQMFICQVRTNYHAD
ncbi:hypothetical protein MKX01_037276 [Papaver californicum]|nr:hypothetical protein MKX01_037276 [Papaver californicum]